MTRALGVSIIDWSSPWQEQRASQTHWSCFHCILSIYKHRVVTLICCCETQSCCSKFSQTHEVDNIAIMVNFIFAYICSFLHYLHHITLVSVKLDVSGYKWIIFQVCKLHWSCSFVTAQVGDIGILVLRRICEKPCWFVRVWEWVSCLSLRMSFLLELK